MQILRIVLTAFVVAGIAAAVQAEEKKIDIKKLLVGKWEAVKVDEGAGLPQGAVVEFKADGKLLVTPKKDGETIEGTYTVEKDGFTANLKDAMHKISVKKLTKTELEVTNDQDKTTTFNRVK